MRKLIWQMNVSLDGCADHRVAYGDDELHDFASAMLEGLDLVLFGRITYQLMEDYWPHAKDDPHATQSMIRFAEKFNALPKIVFSSTLQEARWQNSTLVRTDVVEEVKKLKRQPGKNLSVGGISISQELMRKGLIDEYVLLVHPVIWGKGRPLFEGVEKKFGLKLSGTEMFRSGVVVLKYIYEAPGEE